MLKKAFILFFLLGLILVPVLKANAYELESTRENNVFWSSSGNLHFNGLNDVTLNISLERYFDSSLEYKINLGGKIVYDDTSKLYKYSLLPNRLSAEKTPYSSSSLQLYNIYGVLKILNEYKDEGENDDFIVSLLYETKNIDSTTYELSPKTESPEPTILDPSLGDYKIKINLPDEAITLPDQDEQNFPEVKYDADNRIVYLPFKYANYEKINDHVRYEIIEQEGETSEMQFLYSTLYDGNPFIRLIPGDSPNTMKILRRVSLMERFPNYFADKTIDLKINEFSGLSVIDSLGHQITFSGKFDYAANTSDMMFIANYIDPDLELDRPVQVLKFEASNGKDKKTYQDKEAIPGPPISLSWFLFPEKNINVKITNDAGIVYEGTANKMDDFEVQNFAPGTYQLLINNSLGSKIESIQVNPPEPRIDIFTESINIIDQFSSELITIPLQNDIEFTKDYTNQDFKIDLYGINPADLSIETSFSNDKKFFTQILSKTEKYPGFHKGYKINISQLASSSTPYELDIKFSDLNKKIIIKPVIFLENKKTVFSSGDIKNITSNKDILKTIFENPENEYLILKYTFKFEDLDSIKDKNTQMQLKTLIQQKLNSNESNGDVLGFSSIRNVSEIGQIVADKSVENSNWLFYSFVFSLILSLSGYFYLNKKTG